jgi:hypothetical protein
MVGTAGLEPASPCSQGTWSTPDPHPEFGHAGVTCTPVELLCRQPPGATRPRRDVWGERVHLQHLQRGHSARPIYFGFAHIVGPLPGSRTRKTYGLDVVRMPVSVRSGWCTVRVSSPSLPLERRNASPAAHGTSW